MADAYERHVTENHDTQRRRSIARVRPCGPMAHDSGQPRERQALSSVPCGGGLPAFEQEALVPQPAEHDGVDPACELGGARAPEAVLEQRVEPSRQQQRYVAQRLVPAAHDNARMGTVAA